MRIHTRWIILPFLRIFIDKSSSFCHGCAFSVTTIPSITMGSAEAQQLALNLTDSSRNASNEPQLQGHALRMVICQVIIMFLAIVGNSFLVVVIVRRPRGGCFSPVQILILHACAMDICFALWSLLPIIIVVATTPFFYGGDLVCRLVRYVIMIPMYGSSFVLMAISADRYIAVCRPLLSIRGNKRLRAHRLGVTSWIAAFLCATPQLWLFHWVSASKQVEDADGRNATLITASACTSKYPPGSRIMNIYILWFTVAAWLLPSFISAFLYARICSETWRSLTETGPEIDTEGNGEAESMEFNRHAYVTRLRNRDARRQRTDHMEKQRMKTVKLTLTIVVANFILYSPFCITNLIATFFPNSIGTVLSTYVMLIGNLNSCVNPWIYVVFNVSQVRETLCHRRTDNRTSFADTTYAHIPLTPNVTLHRQIAIRSYKPYAPHSIQTNPNTPPTPGPQL